MGTTIVAVTGHPRRSTSFALRLLGPTLIVALGTLAACGGGGGGGQIQQGGQIYVGPPGETVYRDSCARCHGANREGAVDAAALDATRMMSSGDESLRQLILFGKGRMPGFGGLSEQQVTDVIAYIRS